MNRPRATEAVNSAIDLYADMRGYRKVGLFPLPGGDEAAPESLREGDPD